eukprot:1653103-Amphidinium_carterae.2
MVSSRGPCHFSHWHARWASQCPAVMTSCSRYMHRGVTDSGTGCISSVDVRWTPRLLLGSWGFCATAPLTPDVVHDFCATGGLLACWPGVCSDGTPNAWWSSRSLSCVLASLTVSIPFFIPAEHSGGFQRQHP